MICLLERNWTLFDQHILLIELQSDRNKDDIDTLDHSMFYSIDIDFD